MPSPEFDYLAELMADFPVTGGISQTEVAAELLQLRFKLLLDSEELFGVFQNNPQITNFPVFFQRLASGIHAALFKNILSNAGQYRQPDDPHSGRVHFGLQREVVPPFVGTPAAEIEEALPGAFQNLAKDASDPVGAAVTFYQQFVRIHPYYDANGRIGRLLVSLYLDYHGVYVNWDRLEKRKGIWLRRLNACHNRQGQPELYPKYLGYLVNYFRFYVTPKQEFLAEED